MSSSQTLSVLITGCSIGGMGAALAVAFHNAGHRVFATARSPSKMKALDDLGIETLSLDVTAKESIEATVNAVASRVGDAGLNVLINNAGGNYSMPISDVSLNDAKALFETNVWSHIAVSQAFLPLLLKSSRAARSHAHPTMIVNHTSVGSVTALPFQGIYNSSKAALAMLSETMRMELAPFGIQVIDLKTGGVHTNIITNSNYNSKAERLPMGSIYQPAREVVEAAMSQEGLKHIGTTAEQWASEVSTALLSANPPKVIWKGEKAGLARVLSVLPSGLFEGMLKRMTKLDVVEQIIQELRK